MLETRWKPAILPELSNDSPQDREPEGENQSLPQPGQDRDLPSIIHDFRRVLSADGAVDGDEADTDSIKRDFAILEREAVRQGFLHGGLLPSLTGGVEHDVLPDLATGTILKFTKRSRSAYIVDFDLGTPRLSLASPLAYLNRLSLQLRIFGLPISFVGLGGDEDGRRIITRQPIIEGSPARWEEIIRLMVDDLGFTKLRHNHGIGYEDSYAFVGNDVAVFDMRPANVFTTHDGIVIPVDCIPVRLPRGKRAFFDK